MRNPYHFLTELVNLEMPQGSYVTDETIGKVEDELRPDEEVQYIARGNDVKVKYRGSSESLDYIRGRPRLVVTDQRVFIKVPKFINTHVESFEYDQLTGADLGNSGMSGTRVKFRTVQGKDYSFRADKPEDTELEMMAEFMRERVSGQQTAQSETDSTPTGSSTADRDDLHKAQSCVECGESVSEGVERCPNCGYNPGEHKKWFYIHALLAGVSGATIVGLLIAPFFWIKGRKHRKKYKRGVTG
jgi:hypothetical protein